MTRTAAWSASFAALSFMLISCASVQTIGELSSHPGTPVTNLRLFNRTELESAFALFLPRAEARRYAEEWFDIHAGFDGCLSVDGFFQYTDDPDSPCHYAINMTTVIQEPSPPARAVVSDTSWTNMSDPDLEEYLLSFSDFHLSLISMVSPELAERIRLIRGESEALAARGHEQMRRIIAALRRRQHLPPAS